MNHGVSSKNWWTLKHDLYKVDQRLLHRLDDRYIALPADRRKAVDDFLRHNHSNRYRSIIYATYGSVLGYDLSSHIPSNDTTVVDRRCMLNENRSEGGVLWRACKIKTEYLDKVKSLGNSSPQ